MYPNIMVNRYSMWMGTMRVRAASLRIFLVFAENIQECNAHGFLSTMMLRTPAGAAAKDFTLTETAHHLDCCQSGQSVLAVFRTCVNDAMHPLCRCYHSQRGRHTS